MFPGCIANTLSLIFERPRISRTWGETVVLFRPSLQRTLTVSVLYSLPLSSTLRALCVEPNGIQVIENLYDPSALCVLYQSKLGFYLGYFSPLYASSCSSLSFFKNLGNTSYFSANLQLLKILRRNIFGIFL